MRLLEVTANLSETEEIRGYKLHLRVRTDQKQYHVSRLLHYEELQVESLYDRVMEVIVGQIKHHLVEESTDESINRHSDG